jgi:hypothetical protein
MSYYALEYQRFLPIDRLFIYLFEYGERGFDDLPQSIQQHLLYDGYMPVAREPTEWEMEEAEKDAREHRIVNKELTIQDLIDKYKHGKSLTLVT